jgi:hypothetical protein
MATGDWDSKHRKRRSAAGGVTSGPYLGGNFWAPSTWPAALVVDTQVSAVWRRLAACSGAQFPMVTRIVNVRSRAGRWRSG